jgi:hypothetical protein
MKEGYMINFPSQPIVVFNKDYYMTKREAFAMAAMQGLLTNASLYACTEKDTAKAAVLHADALLAALEAQP